MSTELIINASLPETRISLMEDGEIQELLIERASGKGIVGNIYKGRVTRVLPGMQAAFIDIGLEKAAFLYVDDVFVHSEIWSEEEGTSGDNDRSERSDRSDRSEPSAGIIPRETSNLQEPHGSAQVNQADGDLDSQEDDADEDEDEDEGDLQDHVHHETVREGKADDSDEQLAHHMEDLQDELDGEEDEEEDEEDRDPVGMGPGPDGNDGGEGDDSGGRNPPEGTVAPPSEHSSTASESASDQGRPQVIRPKIIQAKSESTTEGSDSEGGEGSEGGSSESTEGSESDEGGRGGKRHRRGRRGGRHRKRGPGDKDEGQLEAGQVVPVDHAGEGDAPEAGVAEGRTAGEGKPGERYPDNFYNQLSDSSEMQSDRSAMSGSVESQLLTGDGAQFSGRPENEGMTGSMIVNQTSDNQDRKTTEPSGRNEFKEPRAKDRRIKSKVVTKPPRGAVQIQNLLQEGQEVLVQVAKDPIATKGARLTCHISLPGRHLVCMPTIDHVGVSRRIEREDERRRLREYVERYRPKNLGFIVRTASGKQQSEKRIKQDIEYLTRLWSEIREKTATVTAPALVYEDLNSVLRAIRDWVTEEIDKVVVDSRYHFNEIQRFVSHFMPSLKSKVELYHGDIPIFDAYNISTELSRAMERKVWLKSGGYLVIDQAEALVAIDVNTGRFVGKKNLEDTILKTNLEAVQEIAYQLRLRNCGGIIILDLIDMEKEENKQRVYRALEEALKKDRARPTIMKISDLGLVEMTRKRTRDTIIRSLCESCAHCEGKGFIKSKQTVAYEVMRDIEREGIERDVGKILIQGHPEVIDILAIDERETMDQMERRYRKQIYLQAAPDFHPEQFEVISEKRPRGERGEEITPRDSRDGKEESGRDGGGRGGRGGRKGRGDWKTGGKDRNSSDRGGSGGRTRGNPGPMGDAGREAPRDAEGRLEGGRGGEGEISIRPVKNFINPVSASDSGRGDENDNNSNNLNEEQSSERQPTSNSRSDGGRGRQSNERNSSRSNQNSGQPSRGIIPLGAGNLTSGSGVSGGAGAMASEGISGHGGIPAGDDDFFDEEDRLAFLRAQAAQDAALASLTAGAAPGAAPRTPRQNSGGGSSGPGAGRGPNPGGGGGQGRGPGASAGAAGPAGPAGADRGGRGGRNSKRRRGGRGRFANDRGPGGQGNKGDGSEGGGGGGPGGSEGGGNDSGGGGGGDQSSPPNV